MSARLVFFVGLAIALASCATAKCPPCEAAEHGPASEPRYYALPGLDHGLLQSPINILSRETKAGSHTIEIGPGDGLDQVTNTGHTVELSFGEALTLELDGKVYTVKQLHFHTPSEHRIDGITYPMEMHMVHTRPGPTEDGPPDYLVGAIFFRMGKPNPFLAAFLDAVPTEEGQSAELEEVYLEDAVPPHLEIDNLSYYYYQGSLTTPPYTESVRWLVLKDVFEASRDQIQRINRLEGDNARRVQTLYNRTVED